jgi:hypothetical protein
MNVSLFRAADRHVVCIIRAKVARHRLGKNTDHAHRSPSTTIR